MHEEINRVNQVLPTTPVNEKTGVIDNGWNQPSTKWIGTKLSTTYVSRREQLYLLLELELALWKAKLRENEEHAAMERRTKKVKVDAESARKEKRIKCGAEIVIINVLSFLRLE